MGRHHQSGGGAFVSFLTGGRGQGSFGRESASFRGGSLLEKRGELLFAGSGGKSNV